MSEFRGMTVNRYRVWMHSRPAIGRTFYDGKVEVIADTVAEAIESAIDNAARVHEHRDWVIERIEVIQ